MKKESICDNEILITLNTAILSIAIVAGFIITNEVDAQQQQPLIKPNETTTTTLSTNKTLGSFDNQTAIHEVINATRNTNATGVLAGQIINATTPKTTNQTR